ncbi:MAG: AsnC family protein [Gammaproteobacteria bacterium]|nr:AsnC family protein [Gammaproteobacteria bacterium]
MAIDSSRLIEALQNGLPICTHPYAEVASQLGCSEAEVISGIAALKESALVRRFGVVVKHRRLGYAANAMVVWDVADDMIDTIGAKLATEAAVTLCYQRPRKLPHWPYNLFTMLHGKERQSVLQELGEIRQRLKIACKFDVLFSTRCFKQRGARYY